jgi:hypothetical protein
VYSSTVAGRSGQGSARSCSARPGRQRALARKCRGDSYAPWAHTRNSWPSPLSARPFRALLEAKHCPPRTSVARAIGAGPRRAQRTRPPSPCARDPPHHPASLVSRRSVPWKSKLNENRYPPFSFLLIDFCTCQRASCGARLALPCLAAVLSSHGDVS